MKKNPKVILLIGLMFLMIGGALNFMVRGAAAATAEQEAACREQLASQGGDSAAMAHRCNEAVVAIGIGSQRLGLSAPEAAQAMVGWILEGKLKTRQDIRPGLENAATVVKDLYTGGNFGKLLVEVTPP